MDSPKQGYIPGDDDVTEEEEGKKNENFGTVASPPSSRPFFDSQGGIHRDGEQLMVGDSPVFIDPDNNITIKGTAFRGTEELW